MQKTYKNFTVKQSKIKELENCNVLTEKLESTCRKLIGKHHTEKINNIHYGLFSITPFQILMMQEMLGILTPESQISQAKQV